MENKGIPLISINNSMKEHDDKKQVVLGANANTKMGHVKGPWNHIHTSSNSGASASAYASEDGGYTNLTGFSLPPRMYVCSFCKREFRSAQALGGHMNVHRRDRARLRQSPPKELLAGIGPPVNTVADYSNNLNFVPNPNPNLIQSSPLMIQKINTKTATYITDFSKIPSSSLKSSSTCIISSPSRTHASGMMRWSAAKSNPSTTSAATRTPNLYDANNNNEHLHNFQQHVNINKANWEKGGLLRMGFRTTSDQLRKEDDVDLELRLGYSS
ncbi:unnamed protein product [Rhodiola kirilowii]